MRPDAVWIKNITPIAIFLRTVLQKNLLRRGPKEYPIKKDVKIAAVKETGFSKVLPISIRMGLAIESEIPIISIP